LASRGYKQEQAERLVDRLVEVGLLMRGLGIADQEPDYTLALAEAVARLPGERAARAATLLHTLVAHERTLPFARATDRSAVLADVEQTLAELAAVVEVEPLANEENRSLVLEDVASRSPGRTWDQTLLESEAERLQILQRLLIILDLARIER